MKILFVCTANIVRSFMAEVIAKAKLKNNSIDVSSAGIIDMNESPADSIARDILREHGLDYGEHSSRLLTDEMVSEADMIIVMENTHRKIIINEHPESENKIHLLKSFSQDYDEKYGDIKDPYKLSLFQYRLCFSEIYMAIDGLVKCI